MNENLPKMEYQAWDLRRAGEFEKAIELYSRCYEEDKNSRYLYNRGLTYLESGDYVSALEDLKLGAERENPKYIHDAYFIYQGICYWYLNEPSEVLPIWEAGLNVPYTDAAGGVVLLALLLYGAERLGNAHYKRLAIKLLRKHVRRKLGGWPGSIVPFLLDKVDANELKAQVDIVSSNILRSRWQCQADFYQAVFALRTENWDVFKKFMIRASENPYGFHEAEFYLARWEVAHDFPILPFS